MIVILNDGAPLLLYQLFGLDTGYSTGMEIGLFQNDYTPVATSTPGNFTPADFTGYAPVVLNPANWPYPSIVADHPEMTYDAPGGIEWTNTGASQTIYGFFVYNNDIGNYLFAERFDTPRVLGTGQSFELFLKITGGNCPLV